MADSTSASRASAWAESPSTSEPVRTGLRRGSCTSAHAAYSTPLAERVNVAGSGSAGEDEGVQNPRKSPATTTRSTDVHAWKACDPDIRTRAASSPTFLSSILIRHLRQSMKPTMPNGSSSSSLTVNWRGRAGFGADGVETGSGDSPDSRDSCGSPDSRAASAVSDSGDSPGFSDSSDSRVASGTGAVSGTGAACPGTRGASGTSGASGTLVDFVFLAMPLETFLSLWARIVSHRHEPLQGVGPGKNPSPF